MLRRIIAVPLQKQAARGFAVLLPSAKRSFFLRTHSHTASPEEIAKQLSKSENEKTIALLGVPHDCSSSFMDGPALAPMAVRAATMSDSANPTSEQGLDCSGVFCDLGDVGFENLSAAQGKERNDAIRESAMAAISRGNKLISIGGDHSVSFPLILVRRKARTVQHEFHASILIM
jgi:arginase family enzyme